ncbi:pyridoxal-phosphate dependent enzyme, partial [Acidobacteria bacterium ACD]|nr:pyridoxal-phosphate dependent enzyme [Acidobacteria bacterium ACD]
MRAGRLRDNPAVVLGRGKTWDVGLDLGATLVKAVLVPEGRSVASYETFVCAARGYRIRIVSSDAFSREKLDHMAALGAELTLVPSEGGLTTRKLILDMVETAREMSREPGTYWTNQLENLDAVAGYAPLGEEVWEQTAGRVDAFVQSVGTAASLRGVATVLKRHRPGVRVVAVEPAESSVLL